MKTRDLVFLTLPWMSHPPLRKMNYSFILFCNLFFKVHFLYIILNWKFLVVLKIMFWCSFCMEVYVVVGTFLYAIFTYCMQIVIHTQCMSNFIILFSLLTAWVAHFMRSDGYRVLEDWVFGYTNQPTNCCSSTMDFPNHGKSHFWVLHLTPSLYLCACLYTYI